MSAKPIGYLYFRSCIFCNSQSKTMRNHSSSSATATIIASVTNTTAITATTTDTTIITTMIYNPAATTTMVFISDFENRYATILINFRTLDPPLSLNKYDWKVENYTAKMKHSSLYITNKKKWSIKGWVDKKYLKHLKYLII